MSSSPIADYERLLAIPRNAARALAMDEDIDLDEVKLDLHLVAPDL